MKHAPIVSSLLLAITLGLGCGDDGTEEPAPPTRVIPTEVTLAPEAAPFETLAEWGLFEDAPGQVPRGSVIPYEVNAPLFSDYTFKRRFMHVPEGHTIGYRDDGKWVFPVGTILVKTFSYPTDFRDPSAGERLLETRLLVRYASTWVAHTYVWDANQTIASRKRTGGFIDTEWIDLDGQTRTNEYIVPNTNECEECHGEKPGIDTLGGRTLQLHRARDYGDGPVNQIDHLASLGLLDTAPPAEREALVDPFGDAPLNDRVRSYLDANCGHCHTEGGTASQSELLLSWALTDPSQPASNWGTCKTPTSAGGATCGHTYDIVPGDPDSSIFICRLTSTDPEVRMPPLVSRVPHDEGIELIRAWIATMPADDCVNAN